MLLAAVQMASEVARVEANVDKATALVTRAIESGAGLVTLPELFSTGYFSHTDHVDPDYFDLAEPVDGPLINHFRDLAASSGVWINVPFYERQRAGEYFNSAALIDGHGSVRGVYRKTHLPWSMTGWEKFYMRPGHELPVFDTPFGRVGIMLCYDRDFPEVARSLALQGAELLIVPNGASRALTDMWVQLMSVRAYENQVAVLGSCLTGRADAEHHEFCGNSLMVAPTGHVTAQLGREEGLLLAELEPGSCERARRQRFMYRDRRPEIYGELIRERPATP
jgi:predicted amidohydrolase